MSSEQKTTLLGLLKLAQTTLAKIESELADSRNRETAFYHHLSNNKEEIEVAAQALSRLVVEPSLFAEIDAEVTEEGFVLFRMQHDPSNSQHYICANLDKQQFLHPQKCGNRGVLSSLTGLGFSFALIALLANDNKPNQGDCNELNVEHALAGSWAGDRISLIGSSNPLFATIRLSAQWQDISLEIMRIILQADMIFDELRYNYPADPDLPSFEALAKLGLPD